MRLRVLVLAGGALALSGCAGSASGTNPTATTPASHPTEVAQKPSATVAPKPASTTSAPDPVPTSRPVAVHPTGTPYQKGVAYLRAQDWKDAATQFQQSIAAHQSVAASYAGLGRADIGRTNYPAAYRAYRHAADLDPTSALFTYETAYSSLYAQEFHVTVDYAGRYIRMRPSDPAGYHLRFLANGSLLDHKAQLKDAKTIVRLDPKSATAWNDLGIAQANNGKFKDAATSFSHAIALSPTTISYYTNRGLAEHLLKRPDLALKDFEKARTLTTNPNAIKELDATIAALKKELKQG